MNRPSRAAIARELPLVTFAVFAYNQQDFVAAAIEAAFLQDYPNLEIVLSDNCSGDETFSIMKEMQTAYAGPHRVRSNRSGRNEGTLAHLREVVALSNGELLVCAAGDDISYPNRVRRLVEAWQATGADAFFSKYDVIDDNGVLIDRDYRFDSSRLELHGLFPGVTLEPIHGASSAYRRSFLDNVPWPNTPILFEDTFLTLTAAYEKRQVFYVDEPLVQYRRHGRSATNAVYNDVAIDVIRGRETAGERYARSILLILEHLRARAEAEGRGGEIDQSLFGSTIAFYRIRSNWIAASLVQRLRALARIRRTDHARWLLARLLGLGSFARLKRIAAAGGRRAERIADRSTTSRNPPAGSR